MLSKRYESTEVDRRTWLHVPSGTHTHSLCLYKKIIQTCYKRLLSFVVFCTYVPAQLTKDQLLVHHFNTLTKVNVKIDKYELPTFYLLQK